MTADPPAPQAFPPPDRLTPWRVALATLRCVRFYSRLPTPSLPGEADKHAVPDFRVEPIGLPFASLVIVTPAVLMAGLAAALSLDPLLGSALVLTALVIASGAFHEDGLADTADGLFGGHDAERRLEIMKDSRIGVFAGCALLLSFLLRVAALAALWRAGGVEAVAAALAIAAMVSRVEGVRVLATLPSARAYGAAASVGRPTIAIALMAGALALLLSVAIAWLAGLPAMGVVLGLALASLLVTLLAGLARRLIGGQTGDIAGAAQQLAEIGVYLGLAAGFAG